ncbi:MAG: hypothetical protein LBR89_04690 [Holosporales bacterium]|jgi:hypothetical protein|nr:hypothetical protein [Holosporales bacterium]
MISFFNARAVRVCILQWRLLRRRFVRAKIWWHVLRNRHVFVCGGAAIALTWGGVSLWVVSEGIKTEAQDRTIMLMRQHKVMQGKRDNDNEYEQKLRDLGITDLSIWEQVTSVSFTRVLRRLERECHVMRTKCSLQLAEQDRRMDELALLKLDIDMKAARDKNVTEFLAGLVEQVPGVVVFDSININRNGAILSRAEFDNLRKSKQKGKAKPAFSAQVSCRVAIPKKMAADFMK